MNIHHNQGEKLMPTYNGFCIASDTRMFHPEGLFFVEVGKNHSLMDILFPENDFLDEKWELHLN
ncbi:MAG: hypothetical protein H8D97_01225 [Proteobacteria bacterium]|nr:hypothetical protein [Pseudomonadota bacterium]